MVINITPAGVVESTIMYGVVHAFWTFIKVVWLRVEKEARKERNRIIEHHVKSGHKDRLKQCLEGNCSSLQSLAPQEQTQPGELG